MGVLRDLIKLISLKYFGFQMKGAIETQSTINIFSLVKHIWINIYISLHPQPKLSMLQLSYSGCF